MPRPPTSSSSALALRRRPTSSSSSCSCRPPAPAPSAAPSSVSTPRANAYATSSAHSAATSSAAPLPSPAGGPPLDFLYPSFGFFSRALPPAVSPGSYSPSPRPRNGCFASPPPPPSPSPASSPSSFLSAPPPPPRPQTGAFDVRSWRASEGLAAVGLHPPRRTALAGGAVSARCVCGRVKMGCLRCRGKSTSAVGAARAQLEELVEATATPTDPVAAATSRLKDLLSLHAPSSLQNLRGSSIISRSRHPLGSSQRSARKRTTLEMELAVDALWQATKDESLVSHLPVTAQLDLIRAFSRLARALPEHPRDAVDPLSPKLSEASLAARRVVLRQRCSSHMLSLLDRFELWAPGRLPLPSSRTSPTSPSILPSSSSTYSAAALLFLDAVLLPVSSYADPSIASTALSRLSNALAHVPSKAETPPALYLPLIRIFRPPAELSGTPLSKRQQRERARREDQQTALLLLLQALSSFPRRSRTLSVQEEAGEAGVDSTSVNEAEVALRMMHGWGLVSFLEALIEVTPAAGELTAEKISKAERKRRNAENYRDVLRRQYGEVLSRLEPRPSVWLVVQQRQNLLPLNKRKGREPLGVHLVRYLSRSGSAAEALEVWLVAVRRSAEALEVGGDPAEELSERDKLRALTCLVDGMTMERLYKDANALVKELEDLAMSVAADENGGSVAEAYRVLAKLASNQRISSRTEQTLARLAAVQLPPSSSSSPASIDPSFSSTPSLEPSARRIRSAAARLDPAAAQAVFDAVPEQLRLAASAADRARLWSQLILAYTRVNDLSAAVRALQSMVSSGLSAPLAAVNAILFGYARRGDSKTTYELFGELVDGSFSKVQPDVSSWNALVLVHSTSRDTTGAASVINEMKAVGVEPSRQSWTILMSAYVDNGQWMSAFVVFRFLEQHPSPRFRPDTAVTNVMLRACVLTAVPARRVLQLFRRLVDRGFRPDMATYTLVMQSVCSAGLMDVAEELYLAMDESAGDSAPAALPVAMGDIKPDGFIFANLISGYLRTGRADRARAILSEMRSRGIAPTTATTAIILGARLHAHRERDQAYTLHGVQTVLQQTRAFLDDENLVTRRTSQPAVVDRSLARNREAVTLFVPIIRALGKSKDKQNALALFEEALLSFSKATSVGKDDNSPIPLELYSAFIDALRTDEDENEAARNVQVVWDRLYNLVAERYIRLRPDPDAPPPPPSLDSPDSPSASPPLLRLVDPAQSSFLCLPLTMVIETYARADFDQVLETTWRRLAAQGFAFDASNWNALAKYFARDLQLERAMWIAEHVLSVPLTHVFTPFDKTRTPRRPPSFPSVSPMSFLRDLEGITRSSAIGRSAPRLRILRNAERHEQRKQPLTLVDLLSAPAPSATADMPASSAFEDAFGSSFARRSASLWHPYGATLTAIDEALDTLLGGGDVEAFTQLRASVKTTGEEGEQPEGVIDLQPDTAAVDARALLLKKYPRTANAIELWKTRVERQRKEREEYKARRRGGGGLA
ncbi:hypothetical protein JCM8547_006554 [Rhodosporidiobolus lusitaniae]